MKTIFAVTLITLLNVFAGENVTFNFKEKVSTEQAILDTADIFIKEIETFIEKPMEWCKVEPTGEFETYDTGNDKTVNLVVNVKMTCEETMPQKYFASVALRYQPYLLKNGSVVRKKILKKYPDIMFSALMMNHTYAVYLSYNPLYVEENTSPYFHKIKFFRMVLNDEHVSPVLKKFQVRGSLIATHQIPEYPTETQKFQFVVYKKTLRKGNVRVRFEPVYHPSAEDGKKAEKE